MKVQLFHTHHTYNQQTPAISDVSLQLESGDFCFMIGPSGAGKSTLFKLLFAEENPQSGQILVGDWFVHRLSYQERPLYRRSVGYIFQDLKLLDTRSVTENVALPLEAIGASWKAQRLRVHELLHQVGLGHRGRSKVSRLSGGEKQRVAIARALAHRPRMILADEPTGSLDPELSEEIMDLLYLESIKGVTVICSTHDHSLLDRYSARVIELENGRIKRDIRS